MTQSISFKYIPYKTFAQVSFISIQQASSSLSPISTTINDAASCMLINEIRTNDTNIWVTLIEAFFCVVSNYEYCQNFFILIFQKKTQTHRRNWIGINKKNGVKTRLLALNKVHHINSHDWGNSKCSASNNLTHEYALHLYSSLNVSFIWFVLTVGYRSSCVALNAFSILLSNVNQSLSFNVKYDLHIANKHFAYINHRTYRSYWWVDIDYPICNWNLPQCYNYMIFRTILNEN